MIVSHPEHSASEIDTVPILQTRTAGERPPFSLGGLMWVSEPMQVIELSCPLGLCSLDFPDFSRLVSAELAAGPRQALELFDLEPSLSNCQL